MWHAASLSFSPHAGITVSIEVRALIQWMGQSRRSMAGRQATACSARMDAVFSFPTTRANQTVRKARDAALDVSLCGGSPKIGKRL
jgi:hypothetical protein